MSDFTLTLADPFAGLDGDEDEPVAQKDLVHIRMQQRNGRKCITTVQGLNPELDMKKIVKAIKKVGRAPALARGRRPGW